MANKSYKIAVDNDELRKGAEEAKRILHDIGSTASDAGDVIDKAFQKAGRTIAGVFTLSKVKDFVTNVATVRGEFQQLEVAFSTLLQSEGKANRLMSQAVELAAKTPFDLKGVADGARQLLAYGFEAENVMDVMRRLGDVAAGLGLPLQRLTYLYGTTRVQGRLYARDMLQFTNSGIPLLDELAKMYGKTTAEINEMVSAGKIGFADVEKVIRKMTDAGGQFDNLMEKQSKTINGQISNIKDAIDVMFNEIGKSSEGVINTALSGVSFLVEHYRQIGNILEWLIATYGGYKAAVIVTCAVEKAANAGTTVAYLAKEKALRLVVSAQKALNAAMLTNPYVLAVTAITGLVAWALRYNKSIKDGSRALRELNEDTRKLNLEDSKKESVAKEHLNTLKSEKSAQEDRISAMRGLLEIYPELIAKYKDQKAELIDITRLEQDIADAQLRRKMNNDATLLDEYNEKLKVLNEQLSEAKSDLQNSDTADYAVQAVSSIESEIKVTEQKIEALRKRLTDGTYSSLQNGPDKPSFVFGGDNGETKKSIADIVGEIESAQKQIDNLRQKAVTGLTDREKQSLEEYEDALKKAKAEYKTFTGEDYGKSPKGEAKQADEAADRSEQLRKMTERGKMEEKEAALELRQASIDGMKEGFDKQIEQNKLEYDRLILANEKRQQEMLEKLRNVKALEWRNQNPSATKEQEIAYRQTITVADLSEGQKAQIQSFADIAADIQRKRNKEALDEMLADVLSYEQKRQKIEEEFEEKRKALYVGGDESKGLREGVSQENVDELNRQQEDALAAVDEQFASREETYQSWVNTISSLTFERLEAVLKNAQDELEKAKQSGVSGTKLAEAQAKVATAQKAVTKAKAEDAASPGKRTIKEWEDLYGALMECEKEFERIGDAVGGVAGEAIKTAGSVMTSTLSMIRGISQFATMSTETIADTATATEIAISTVEKASVILTVISAAMQIAMQIIELFNTDKQKQAQIESLQGEVDQLQWELDHQDIVRIHERYSKAIDLVRQKYRETYNEIVAETLATLNFSDSVSRLHGSQLAYMNTLKRTAEGYVDSMQSAVIPAAKKIAEAYANMSYSADKALGSAKYDEAKAKLENIAQQQVLINKQIELEQSKKSSDDKTIEEWERKIEELGGEAIAIINELVEDIVGGSSDEIASKLGDAFIDAFKEGEDAAKAWGDKVNDIVSDVVKRMLVSRYLEEPLGEIFDKYKAKWFKDGNFVGIDSVIESMSGFAADLNAVGDDFAKIWESLPDTVRNMMSATEEATREASQKGIATASQESVDELNGRMTAVQGHTYNIAEGTRILQENTSEILRSVLAIENNTARLEGVEAGIRSVRDTLNDISMKGVKII